MEHTSKRRYSRHRGRIAKSERTRDGQLEVLADHNTDGSVVAEPGRWGTEVLRKNPIISFIACVFRVRQIEKKALKKLKPARRGSHLSELRPMEE